MKRKALYRNRVNHSKATCLLMALMFCSFLSLDAQNVSFNESGTAPDPSAMMDVSATDKGMLIPRMTAADRLAITSPANGLMVFQTDPPRGFYAYFSALNRWSRITQDSTLSLSDVLMVGNNANAQNIINVNRLTVGNSSLTARLKVSDPTFPNLRLTSGTASTLSNAENSGVIELMENDVDFESGGFGFQMRYIGSTNDRFQIRSATSAGTDTLLTIMRGSGRMGVRHDLPQAQLHVNSTIGSVLRLEREGTGEAFMQYVNSNYDLTTGLNAGGDFGIQNTTNTFGSKFIINNAGNVGIGTETPFDKLEVFNSGNVRVRTNTSSNGYSGLVAENSLGEYFMGVQGAFDPFPGEFHIFQNSFPSGQRMVIDNAGNMGVGISNPAARFHVSYNSTVTNIIESSSTSGTWLALRNSSTGGKYHQIISTGFSNGEGAGKLLFGYGNSYGTVSNITMTIDDRRIGIRTSSPSNDLEILQSDAIIGGTGGLRNTWGTTYWRLFHSGLHYSFENDGTRYAYVEQGTGNYVQPSDRELKENIKPLNTVLKRVSQLKPVNYNYIGSGESENKRNTYGFIAQEVFEIFPSLVHYGENNELGLAYSEFSVIAIKAIQEQQEKINELEQRIEHLEELISKIQTEE